MMIASAGDEDVLVWDGLRDDAPARVRLMGRSGRKPVIAALNGDYVIGYGVADGYRLEVYRCTRDGSVECAPTTTSLAGSGLSILGERIAITDAGATSIAVAWVDVTGMPTLHVAILRTNVDTFETVSQADYVLTSEMGLGVTLKDIAIDADPDVHIVAVALSWHDAGTGRGLLAVFEE